MVLQKAIYIFNPMPYAPGSLGCTMEICVSKQLARDRVSSDLQRVVVLGLRGFVSRGESLLPGKPGHVV
jgi:hypothetical protein